MNEEEVWKDIIGYEGEYQISNYGQIKSLKRNIFLALDNQRGYRKVGLRTRNRKRKRVYVHRLVALHFLQNPEKKPQINHIDCNKSNNNIFNLEWCDNSQNMEHAIKNNLIPTKVSDIQCREIRRLYLDKSNNFSHKKLAVMFGISKSQVTRLINGKRRRLDLVVDNPPPIS